jgi:3-hydroxyacyl-CoA dehydrogenase / enoyl-CoA hydratase / 3-hydroxybutyryl-CoA epimerase
MSEDQHGTVRWERGSDGIVVLTFDDPVQGANTMNHAFQESMGWAMDRLEAERDEVVGVILASAKPTFFAGGDLNDLVDIGPGDEAAAAALVSTIKGQLRRLETYGRPVVATINGAALGGGLEIALAAHHRVVLDGPKVRLGVPEVTLGLCPGAGGVVRLVRMLGITEALTKMLLQGQRLRPAEALELGIADELVTTADELIPAAKAWIAANPDATQPWDRDGYRIPGGTPADPRLAANLAAYPANLRKQLGGAPYPAPGAIMAAAVEGAQVDIESAFQIEERYFVNLAVGQVSENMIRAFFFDMQKVNGKREVAAGIEVPAVEKAAVLGAGMMGAAIAYVCASAGVEVALLDVDAAAAERGKGYSERLLEKAVERGRRSRTDADAILARIVAGNDYGLADGAGLVIEAVFEDPEVKGEVLAKIEPHLDPDALLASNTSSLPITGLGERVTRPEDFIGLHFFSPVDKMPLLEIVKGERTSDRTLARALAVAKLLGKTPIVVNDSRGFFTSRVIATFIEEGIAMLEEGVPAPSIEQASKQAGYPAPVLQLCDELSIALMRKIRDETRAGLAAEGGSWEPHPADRVMDTMVVELDRAGRAAGGGFYDYEDGKRVGLWPGLKEAFPPGEPPALAELEERLLFIEAIESIRCLEEGVIESVADANVGSMIGIGYPGWTGGVLQYANQYEGGLPGFLARARELADRYGARFEPPVLLVERAERGERFADAAPAVAPA